MSHCKYTKNTRHFDIINYARFYLALEQKEVSFMLTKLLSIKCKLRVFSVATSSNKCMEKNEECVFLKDSHGKKFGD